MIGAVALPPDPADPASRAAATLALRHRVAEEQEVLRWEARTTDRAAAAWLRGEGLVRTGPGRYGADAVALHARHLLGRVVEGRGTAVRLTEVEAYAGPDDPASHAVTRTPRSEVMHGAAGRLYVYRSYGLHLCANVVTGPVDHASAVLLRAGEVVAGLDLARSRRVPGPDARLARGPGNLAAVLGLEPTDTGLDLLDLIGSPVRLAPAPLAVPGRVVAGPRVGVSRAAEVPWRFHLAGEPSVSSYRRSPRAPALPPSTRGLAR